MEVLNLIDRNFPLFEADIQNNERILSGIVQESRFLVIGGAGSIGQAVTREIFKRNPRVLHVVDISENNMVELVRDIRSTLGYNKSDFSTYAIDCGSYQFDALMRAQGGYDYILNLSALKHVRSEKDPFTLMRMIDVNILNTISTIQAAHEYGAKKYFCVSTDKAANPVNMMGASKKIMELFLMRESEKIPISTARFANVAFSDGSLLHGFNQRFAKFQPITAPNDVLRYFVTPQESGELCLLSCLMGANRDIFYPKMSDNLKLTRFSDIAIRFLMERGYKPRICASEDEAREGAAQMIKNGVWPVYFFKSDTTGEKGFEEFFTNGEVLDTERFDSIGVVLNQSNFNGDSLDWFLDELASFKNDTVWNKSKLVKLFNSMLPEFKHIETGKYLDNRM